MLLIPRILDCSPQQMNAGALLLALRFAAEMNNPCFRLGYNSLGAFATVNHLHFQVRSPCQWKRVRGQVSAGPVVRSTGS